MGGQLITPGICCGLLFYLVRYADKRDHQLLFCGLKCAHEFFRTFGPFAIGGDSLSAVDAGF